MSESRLTHEEDEDRADEEPFRVGLVALEVGSSGKFDRGGGGGGRDGGGLGHAACVCVGTRLGAVSQILGAISASRATAVLSDDARD